MRRWACRVSDVSRENEGSEENFGQTSSCCEAGGFGACCFALLLMLA